jgi:hypothetical protein
MYERMHVKSFLMKKTDKPEEKGTYIFRMTITLKSGKVIRRPNGKPFKILIKN